MTLEEINRSGELVLERVSSNARVTWGAMVNKELEGSLKATVVLSGVDSPFLERKDNAPRRANDKPVKKAVAKKAASKPATKSKSKTAKKSVKLSRS